MNSYFKVGEEITRLNSNSVYIVVQIENRKNLPDMLLIQDKTTGFTPQENENFCFKRSKYR